MKKHMMKLHIFRGIEQRRPTGLCGKEIIPITTETVMCRVCMESAEKRLKYRDKKTRQHTWRGPKVGIDAK